jgi:hypothetical protein
MISQTLQDLEPFAVCRLLALRHMLELRRTHSFPPPSDPLLRWILPSKSPDPFSMPPTVNFLHAPSHHGKEGGNCIFHQVQLRSLRKSPHG